MGMDPNTKHDNITLSELEIDAIGEILNISMGAAATAVSSMLDKQVLITTPKVSVKELGKLDYSDLEPAMMVKITYVKGITGSNIMVFRQKDMQYIINTLMGIDGPLRDDFVFDDMSMSAACEVMNQMMGASATALSEFLGRSINISIPTAYIMDENNTFNTAVDTESDENIVAIFFDLIIADVMKSEFVCVMRCELARLIINQFMYSGEPEKPAEPAHLEQEEQQPVHAAESSADVHPYDTVPAAGGSDEPIADDEDINNQVADQVPAAVELYKPVADQVPSAGDTYNQAANQTPTASVTSKPIADHIPAAGTRPEPAINPAPVPPQGYGTPAKQPAGYEQQAPGYPPQAAGYPQPQPGYAPVMPAYPPPAAGYADIPGFNQYPPGYPPQVPGYQGMQYPPGASYPYPGQYLPYPQPYPVYPPQAAPPYDPRQTLNGQYAPEIKQAGANGTPAPKDAADPKTAAQTRENSVLKQAVNVKNVQFPSFQNQAPVLSEPLTNGNIDMLMNVPLSVSIEIGRTKKKIKEIMDFNQGSIIELEKQAGAPVDIVVNGQLMARGDVVVIDDNFAVRITEIVGTKELISSVEGTANKI